MKYILTKHSCKSYSDFIINFFSKSQVFFDLETTGLSPRTSYIYLIGAVSRTETEFLYHQWLCESINDEKEVCNAFLSFINAYDTLVHFNGATFDLPFIKARFERYHISTETFASIQSYDLLKEFSPFQKFFSLPDKKQKTWEEFLHTGRKDPFTGGDLISVYQTYTDLSEGTEKKMLEKTLLLHNYEDIEGLVSLLSLRTYLQIFDEGILIDSIEQREYLDFTGIKANELFILGRLSEPVPTTLKYQNSWFYVSIEENTMFLRIPLFHETLFHYYKDYKNYYYLPAEDMAIHKSIASFMEANVRQKATPETCYQKRLGFFLRQPSPIFEPLFFQSYDKNGTKKGHESFCPWSQSIFNQKSLASYLKECYLTKLS